MHITVYTLHIQWILTPGAWPPAAWAVHKCATGIAQQMARPAHEAACMAPTHSQATMPAEHVTGAHPLDSARRQR